MEFGDAPPEWDIDHNSPIPDSLIPYAYIYSADFNSVLRQFILPESFILEATQLPIKSKGIEKAVFGVTYYDAFIRREVEYEEVDGNILHADLFTIPGEKRRSPNQIAPQVNSPGWDAISQTQRIINPHHPQQLILPQLRREYKIIQTLYSPPYQ